MSASSAPAKAETPHAHGRHRTPQSPAQRASAARHQGPVAAVCRTVQQRKAGQPPAFSPPSPSMRWPNAAAAYRASPRRGAPATRKDPSTAPTSKPCRWSPRRSSRARRRRQPVGQGRQSAPVSAPGGGKTHLATALGLALIENGWRVLFTRTTDLVQKLQVARRGLNFEAAINQLDRALGNIPD